MPRRLDLGPASARMAALVSGVAEDQLDEPTPCPEMSLGDLIDHVGASAWVFGAVAGKAPPVSPGPARRANLEPGWRERIAGDLEALASAWREPGAMDGVARAGGVEMPRSTMAVVALDELVVHGWDVAVASGQPYEPEPADVDAATAFATGVAAPRDGSLFGPVVATADDAPPLHRLLGLTGRDPAWAPSARA